MGNGPGRWLPIAVAGMLLLGAACTNDDDDSADGDVDVDADVDGDTDGDTDGGGVPNDYPRCEPEESAWVSVYSRGDSGDAQLQAGLTMFVTRSGRDGVTVAEDYACDPRTEIALFMDFQDAPAEAWLPDRSRQVRARLWPSWDGGYAELRSPDGRLIWEGGTISTWDETGAPSHFEVEEIAGATPCTPDELPADDPCCCALRLPLRTIVSTDDGDIALAAGESRTVTVEGEEFVAVVVKSESWIDVPCQTDGGGGGASAYLVRTSALDLPVADPGPAAVDDCPADMPAQWSACTTRAGLRCDFTWGSGCTDTYECVQCYWHVPIRSGGIECGFDPANCMTNGDDGACSEEAVCTSCPCPDSADRYRCVWPGDECPACE